MSRKTHRSKSHKRRHSRRHTRKNGGGCTSCTMRGQWGGRGGLGGAEVGHAFTTGASQTLYQMTGRTPGLSSGGSRASQRRRREQLAATAVVRNSEREAQRRAMLAALARNAAAEGKRRGTKRRHNSFKKAFVMGMPLPGYEGNEYKHLSRNEMKNKIREQALSEYVRMFGNNENFNELNLEINENNENENENESESENENEENNENMGNVIIPGNNNKLKNLRKKSKKNKKN
jgi:hypothetical protein